MGNGLFKRIKEERELREYKRNIEKLSKEEQDDLNKVLNFAVTWWLKDVNKTDSRNVKDELIDSIIGSSRDEDLTEEQLTKVENFKEELAFAVIKELLKDPEREVVLHCGYYPDGILGECINKTDCEFLNLRVPMKSSMMITREQIHIKEGYSEKVRLAYDVKRSDEFPCTTVPGLSKITDEEYEQLTEEEKDERAIAYLDGFLNGDTYIVPETFKPSSYDFFEKRGPRSSYRKSRFN